MTCFIVMTVLSIGRAEEQLKREKRTVDDLDDFTDDIPGAGLGKKLLKRLMKGGGVPPRPVLVGFVEQRVPVPVPVPAAPYSAPYPAPYQQLPPY